MKKFLLALGKNLLFAAPALLLLVLLAYNEDEPHLPAFREAYHQIESGQLKPDASGEVKLPLQYARFTFDGHASVTRRGDLLLVLFPTWRGNGHNLRGYLFCNRALGPDDVKKDEFSGQFDTVAVVASSVSPQDHRDEVVIEEELDNNVYEVSRSID